MPSVRREKRRRRREEEILEAAMRVFETKGYPRATMEDIAEAALLSRVALYNYFKDKEAILKALIEQKTSALKARLDAVPEGDYASTIRALAQTGVRFQEENRGFFRALYTATGLPEMLRDPRLKANKRALIEAVARRIAAAQAAGEAKPGKPEELAEYFLNLLFSVTVRDFFEPDEDAGYDPAPIAELFLFGTAR